MQQGQQHDKLHHDQHDADDFTQAVDVTAGHTKHSAVADPHWHGCHAHHQPAHRYAAAAASAQAHQHAVNPLLIWSVLVALLTPAPAYRSPPSQLQAMKSTGRLSIPAVGIKTGVVEGSMKMYNSPNIFLPELDHGPALYPANALPWQRGTVIMSGHRITHSHPFRNLGNVRLGEIINVVTRWGIFRYRIVHPPPGAGYVRSGYATTTSPCVTRRACAVFDTLTPSGNTRNAWVFTWHRTSGHRLVLAACTPKGQDQWRLLVFGRLVSVTYGRLMLPVGSLGWDLAIRNGIV